MVNTRDLKRAYKKVKSNKTYMIIIVALFFLFGKTGVGSKILTFPLLRYFILYFIVNYRIKDRWTSLYVVLFVYACFTVAGYLDSDDKKLLSEMEDVDSEDSDEMDE